MITAGSTRWVSLFMIVLLVSTGCFRSKQNLETLNQTFTVAVAPALNHSGATNFDPLKVADIMVSELQSVPGVRVIPLNRTLAQLEFDGRTRIESPAHALQVMEKLGADGIIVFAVTEFDPYDPPVLGITAQLYGYGPGKPAGFDPIESSRSASPYEGGTVSEMPRGEFQRVFHGSDEETIKQVKRFADHRNGEDSPLEWRKFLVTQEGFWRFCCHMTAESLIYQELTHVLAQVERQKRYENYVHD